MEGGIKTAAAYIRVSTEDQAELSPETQLEKIREYARANGYFIPAEFVFTDAGISGRRAAKRPGFNAMIAAAREKDNGIEAVLVWKFSRFARNQEESIVYKAMLRKDGVDVLSVSEPLAEGPFGSLIERILEWMDEYYSIRLAGEVKRSMTVKARQGGRQIAPPFGYRLDGRRMVPHETEADLVREIFCRFINGEGYYPIARDFNSRGIRTHRGGRFENRTVEYIVRNPVYIGKIRWTPTGRARRDFKNPDTIIADGDHEPLIDLPTWDAAQARVAAVKEQWGYKARPVTDLNDWLSGIVRCSECGSTLIFAKPHYFKCNAYCRGMCRSSQHIRVDLLHEAIIQELRAVADGEKVPEYEAAPTNGAAAEERKRIEQALDVLARKLDRMRDSYAAGVDTLEDYKAFREQNDRERAELLEKLKAVRQGEDPEQAAAVLRAAALDAVGVLEDPGVSLAVKNSAARALFKECVFDKRSMTLRILYRIIL